MTAGRVGMFVYFAATAVTGFLAGLSRVSSRRHGLTRGPSTSSAARSQQSRWTFFDLLALSALVSVSALRFDVGTDYAIYALNYAQIQPEYWDYYLDRSPLDWGYTQLTIALRYVSDFPYLIFWVTSAITIVPVYVTIKKQSLDPTVAILLYILLAFYVAPMNAIRQGMAVALNFWASTFLENKPWLFVTLNVIASSLHLTAAVAAIIQAAVWKWRPRTGGVVVALIASVAAVLLLALPTVRGALASVASRYEVYLEPDPVGVGTYLTIAFKLALLLYTLYVIGARPKSSSIGLVLVGLTFLIVGTQYLVLARMEMYFGIFIILALPNALSTTAWSPRRKAAHKTVLLGFAVIYFLAYLQNYAGLVPYETYL